MATEISSFQSLYDLYKSEVEAYDGDLTDFNEGSLHDIIAGALGIGMNELSELIVSEFKKTFFGTSHGPEVTGGVDDLRNLAVDHFGESFERPSAVSSTVDLTFSRPNSDAGNVTIPAGTIVKTAKDSEGNEIRFTTDEEAIMTGLSVEVGATAEVAGTSGNVDPDLIVFIESTLTDASVTVNNDEKAAGGEEEQDDATYRETIRSLIQALAGATKKAIEGAIKSVSGVNTLTLIEEEKVVIEYDIATSDIKAGAAFFRIPYPVAYIADANGASSQALIDSVVEALQNVRACGVNIQVKGATQVSQNWDGAYTLDAGGPNYSTLQSSPTMIIDTMKDYLKALPIGTGFNRADANAYILAIWGPSGTGDIVNFNTNAPIANVAVGANDKIVDGVVSINGATS